MSNIKLKKSKHPHKMRRYSLILTFIIIGFAHVSKAQKAINRSKSQAKFTVTNLGMQVEGNIRGMYGSIKLDQNDLPSSFVKAYLDIKAIRTGNKKRDEHLMNEDFFNMAHYPKMSFESSSIKNKNGQWVAIGILTIKKSSKTIEVPFSKKGSLLTAQFTIDRQDYGVDSGSLLAQGISDEVNILLTVQLEE